MMSYSRSVKIELIKTLIMAGGGGSRLAFPVVEKPLIRICGLTMIERVSRMASQVSDELIIVASKHTPRTAEWALNQGYKLIFTEGMNYPEDLKEALKKIEPPALILPADLPFITKELLEFFLERASKRREDIITLIVNRDCFPKGLRKTKSPVGISLTRNKGITFGNITLCKYPELLDIDTLEDFKEALSLCWRP